MARPKPELQYIPVDKLARGKYQPRRQFDKIPLQELAESIKSTGIIQPIVVRPSAETGCYEIIAGERRWRAAQLAELNDVPCLINHYTDEQTAAVTTIENINRVDLNPIEEGKAYKQLMDEFGYIHEEIAAVVGKSRAKITNSLRLLKLEHTVQQWLIEGKLSEGHGKMLASLSEGLQLELARKTVSSGWNVRKLEQEVKRAQSNPASGRLEIDPNVRLLETALTEHIGCKVKIDSDERKGQLKIDFHNLDILEGIFQKMGFKFEDN